MPCKINTNNISPSLSLNCTKNLHFTERNSRLHMDLCCSRLFLLIYLINL